MIDAGTEVESVIDEKKDKCLEEAIKLARNELTTDRLDLSYGEIISMYERDEIVIDPDFQRFFRWTDYQKTRFLESILLGIPTPPIFVAEDNDGKWELVDGLQRLSTILSFFGLLKKDTEKNDWIMMEGDIIEELESYNKDTLPLKFQRNIKRAYCRVEIIKWDSKLDMRYELFNRLNTGGSTLTEQEIRNCIFRGISSKFNDYLKGIANSEQFIDLINISEQRLMEGYLEELVLRFSSLYDNWNNVSTKNMTRHMTQFMRSAIEEDDFDYSLEDKLTRVINILSPIGYKIFRFDNNQFSTSLYDAIMVGIAMNIDNYEKMSPDDILRKIEQLKVDDEFRKYTGSASSSKSRVIKRMNRAIQLFGES